MNLLLLENAFEWEVDWRFYLMIVLAVVLIAVIAIAVVKKDSINSKALKFTLLSIIVAIITIALIIIVLELVEKWPEIIDYTQTDGFNMALYITMIIATVLIVIAIALGVILLDAKNKSNQNTTALVYAALCIALSFALSYVRIFKMPQGGSVTLASLLPIALYAYIFGVRKGLVCCFVYGLLQMVQDPYFAHPIQILLDYPLAFLPFGITAIFKKITKPALGMALGLTIALCLRYLFHVLSGSIYFASYAPEDMNPWIYSLGYNSYVFIDGLIVVIASIALLSSKHMQREINRIESKFKSNVNAK